MTCIVGVKGKFGTILAGDTRGSNNAGDITDGIQKVFKYNYSKQGIACCGSVKAMNYLKIQDSLIDYKDILDNIDIDLNYVISNIAPIIDEIQKATTEKSGVSSFIFATDKRLFEIQTDSSVIETIKPYIATGSTGAAAMAVLEAGYYDDIDEETALDLAITAIQMAGQNNTTSNFDVYYEKILTTEYEYEKNNKTETETEEKLNEEDK